jgi:hypothetical protein
MTGAPGPYVPDRFIPESEQRLGRRPECEVRGCDAPARDGAGDAKCRDHWAEDFFGGTVGECPDCGGDLVGMGGGADRWTLCLDCREQYGPRSTEEEKRERRRQSRLRDAHNQGNFMPKSVSEWYEDGGRR